MKNSKYIKNTLLLGALIFFMGCDTWESNINMNPNDPPAVTETNQTDYDPSQFMLDMVGNAIRGFDYVHWNIASAVCEYHGKTISLSQGNRHQAWHAFDDAAWGGPWKGGYTSVRYIKKMRAAAKAMGDKKYEAIADIWECYTFFYLTLLYGDIPYTQTLLDNSPINPVYDKQEDIYFSLISKLRSAGKTIEKGSMIESETDLIYSGDLTKWRKFANTMMIRYAMYMSDVALDSTKAILAEILDDPDMYPIFESNSDNAQFHYDGTEYQSRYYNLAASKIDEAPFSNVFVERLVSLADPRLPVYARPVLYTHSDPT